MCTLKHICNLDSDWFSHPDAPRNRACAVESYQHGLIGSLFSTYWTKMTKMKQNYTTIMIMNVPGTLCQLTHYFPGKQGLAINLTWPVLKSKQRMCVLPISADQYGFSFLLLAFKFGVTRMCPSIIHDQDFVFKKTFLQKLLYFQ